MWKGNAKGAGKPLPGFPRLPGMSGIRVKSEKSVNSF